VQSVPIFAGGRGVGMLAAVGASETLLALWVLVGVAPRMCAAVQTVMLLSMNVIELTFARQHLLWPAGLIPVNVVFLAMAWSAAELRRTNVKRNPLYFLRRHPMPIVAHFEHCLVLTYALPRQVLEPLLPPGLVLDRFDDFGFVAVAMVKTRGLRPSFPPPQLFGQEFVLTGYRVFTKFHTPAGRTIRGLRIIRSDANKRLMVVGGNLLTHYNYRKCVADVHADHEKLEFAIRTPHAEADVDVVADTGRDGVIPDGSPFKTFHEARRFAGPLPFTFDYEPETHSIIAIRGVRENWSPRLVNVDVRKLTFFDQPSFLGAKPILASAFYVSDIPYRWNRGVRHPLAREERS
jgi:hypothetical protein